MTLPDNITIQLGLAVLGTVIGSVLTFYIKGLGKALPIRAINWIMGALIYGFMVILKTMDFSPVALFSYTLCMFGFNKVYDAALKKVYAEIQAWWVNRGSVCTWKTKKTPQLTFFSADCGAQGQFPPFKIPKNCICGRKVVIKNGK